MPFPPERAQNIYSLILAIRPTLTSKSTSTSIEVEAEGDWRLGEITVDWVDFTREKSSDRTARSFVEMPREGGGTDSGGRKKAGTGSGNGRIVPGSAASAAAGPSSRQSSGTNGSGPNKTSKQNITDPDALSLQPLLAHFPSPSPLSSSHASGISEVGRGVVHVFRHAPPPSLIASLNAHPIGEGSSSKSTPNPLEDDWAGDKAEGEDGSLVAILAVPAWMRPADFLEFIGGWGTCLEGVRMIREASTPNRSIVLLKFRDPLQAADFSVIFTGRAFSTLDARETCHPIRIHHLILHKLDQVTSTSTSTPTMAIPAFPPSVYASRVRDLPTLLKGVPQNTQYELPSCPVCLERLDSTVTGLVTLPCAHTFDCDCLRKWGDSRCPVCRLSHLLLSSSALPQSQPHPRRTPSQAHDRGEITRLTKCSMCGITENNWICVVCGVVGCGRYEPGKGHARRHWEESGHVLAMELETQRVWDYKGDNYVHRLIQTKNDGKLVELPSASSLVTPSAPRVMPLGSNGHLTPERRGSHAGPYSASPSPSAAVPPGHNGSNRSSMELGHHGPSSNDIDKISSIESITLEYSYLLSSQLESMRQHYEKESDLLRSRLTDLERSTTLTADRVKQMEESEKSREKAERKAERAIDLSRSLQATLEAEKAMSKGLSERIKNLERKNQLVESEKKEKEDEVQNLEETVRDLMFSLEAGIKVQEAGGESGEGGDLVVVPSNSKEKEKTKKKGKK